jgi:hypothetical protein
MRMRTIVLTGVALGLLAAAPAAAKDCDRDCQAAVTDTVVAAFQAGDPGKTLKGVRITENGRDIRLPDSQLHAIRKLTYTHVFIEPDAGAVGVYGAAEAAGGPAIFSLRLKLKGDRVTEAETVVARRGEASLFSPQTMAGKPEWDRELPAARRTPREAMIAAANAYFDGIEAESGAAVPAAPGCNRYENGAKTTNRPGGPQEGCKGLGGFAYIEKVRDRRFPLVDEARGLVWALVVFDIPGGTYPNPAGGAPIRREPRSILINELFKLEAGQIQDIEVVMRNVPLGASAGWALPKPPKPKK